MPLAVVGISHRTAPLEVRERLAFRRSETSAVLAGLLETGAVSEAALLSTCNRTELYLVLPDEQQGIETVKLLLAARAGEIPAALAGYLYVHRDRYVAEHLFRVAAGLESMVLGESQIQGQVREAYQEAREVTTAGRPVVGAALNRIFQTAMAVGGRVRSETEVGVGAASVSSAAVELTRKIFGSLRGRRALVLGAGEMTEVTLECLRVEGVRSTLVANRTHERARELAARCGGDAIHWEEFAPALRSVDIVISSTAAPHAVLTRERFRQALPAGSPQPLCIIDIAVPRDVEPTVGDESNVFLYNIDDLRQIVDDNLDRRRAQIPRAEAIIAAGVEEFWSWYAGLAVIPTLRDLREHTESLRQRETERLLRRLSHLAPEDQDAIDALTRSLLNKLLHSPSVRLREAASNGRGTAVLDTVRYLFELDEQLGKRGAPRARSVAPEQSGSSPANGAAAERQRGTRDEEESLLTMDAPAAPDSPRLAENG